MKRFARSLLVLTVLFNCEQGSARAMGVAGQLGQNSHVLKLLAGNVAGAGEGNGNLTSATMTSPSAIAIDSSGNIFFMDNIGASNGNVYVRMISTSGVVSTIAGGLSYFQDGVGAAAGIGGVGAIVFDGSGNMYISDNGYNRIRNVTTAGAVTNFAGSAAGGYADGASTVARFSGPAGLAFDNGGNMYVADSSNCCIRKITSGGVVSTIAGSKNCGYLNGTGTAAQFNAPTGIAVDSSGNLFVAELANNTIRKITAAGVVTTFAGSTTSGFINGSGGTARFNQPEAAKFDGVGNLYIADTSNNAVRKITPTGVVTTLAGNGPWGSMVNGSGTGAYFSFPTDLAIDSVGNVYVADSSNNLIRKVTPAGIVTTYAGAYPSQGSTNGAGTAARFKAPSGLVVDSGGNVFVADASNSMIRKVTPAGVVTTFAGSTIPGSTDGTGVNAKFKYPQGLAKDSSGNFYVADSNNNLVRKITSAGVVTTVAGNTSVGSGNGSGTAATFNSPTSLAVDASGNIFVSDTNNNLIRKITPAGIVSTFAGTFAGGFADGSGAAAAFSGQWGIAVDGLGNLLVADTGNNAIRKITPTGVVSTLTGGNGIQGFADGSGTNAQFAFPEGVAIDSANNIYVADTANNCVRKVTPAGVVTTVLGNPLIPSTLTGAPAPALLNGVIGIAIFNRTLYITSGNGVLTTQVP